MEEEEHVWGLGTAESRCGDAELATSAGYAQRLPGAVFLHVSKYGNFSTLRENISEADVLKVPPIF